MCYSNNATTFKRERKGDVEKLIEYFLRIKSFKLNKQMPEIKEDLYNSLLSYNWPGNIRQLENYIENIVNLDGKLSFDLLEDCDEKINEVIHKNEIETNYYENCEVKEENFNLEGIESKIINEAIKSCNYNMTKVAKALGISRNTLYLKIKKYKIKV